jgi:hypothetical protein
MRIRRISLLSALSLFTFTGFLHVSAGEHAAIMSLQELRGFIKRVHVLPLSLLFFPDNFCQVLPSAVLLLAFSPLLANLSQLLLMVFKIMLLVVTLSVLLPHLRIIGLQSFRILLLSSIELAQKRLLCSRVLSFGLNQVLVKVFNCFLKFVHVGEMMLLLRILQTFASCREIIFILELLLGEVLSSLLEILNFDA